MESTQSPEAVDLVDAYDRSQVIPIYTIGYGARELESVLALLKQHEIRYLIDVRTAPYSRYKPAFSKEPLQNALAQWEIRYVFMGDTLGGRPVDDGCYTDGKVDYDKLAIAPFYRTGIERLQSAFTQQQRVALLCSEGRPEACHRSLLIGKSLTKLDIPVLHIDENDALVGQDAVLARLAAPTPDPAEQPGLFDEPPPPLPHEPPPHLYETDPPYYELELDAPLYTMPTESAALERTRELLAALPDDPMEGAQHVLRSIFGYDDFWPLQAESIANLFARRDTLVIMPTGGGKSLCYQIPALVLPGLTVVVSPLISLMQDQVNQLRDLGLPAAFINSMLSQQEQEMIKGQTLRGEIKLLYLAPETLLRPDMLALLDECPVDCLAIDEAHCISSWGHDFRPEYRQLHAVRTRLAQATCIALTATATPRVQADIRETLGFTEKNSLVGSFNRGNLFLAATPRMDGIAQVLGFLAEHRDQSGIIYCSTRKDADGLADRLTSLGWSALSYHAGLDAGTRRHNQEEWVRDNVSIMVATVAFGMGIDKSNVRFVVHYNLPQSIEGYYQEVGRAGRDGLRADCLLLHSLSDTVTQRYFIDNGAESERAGRSARLQAMWRYAETQDCRRPPLLGYFGETFAEPCGFCDNCQQPQEGAVETDVTVAAQKFLSCVLRTREIFGVTHIINVLRGSQAKSVISRGHDKLSTYGIGTEYTTQEWRELAQQFIALGLLEQDMTYGSLKLTDEGRNVFNGEPVTVAFRPKPVTAQPEMAYDTELFTQLRQLRKSLADEANLPAYIVFSDRALVEMATYFPQNEAQLLAINGVGAAKLASYGEPFLILLQSYCREHNRQPLAKGAEALGSSRPTTPGKKRFEEVGERFVAGESIEQIRASYNVKLTTVVQHLATYQQAGHHIAGERVLTASSLTPEAREPIFAAFAELGPEYLSPIYEKLNRSVPYEELHLLRIVYISQYQPLD